MKEKKIPKKIHYCWFGKQPKSKLILKCIESWKKFLPDYEIIEWNEDNFDFGCNKYVEEAYKAKKWAFVADYARLWAVYNYGGVYFDTDVELLKNIDDILTTEAFFCYEKNKINTGLGFGAIKGNFLVKELMNNYNKRNFILANGKYDLTTCVNIAKETFENFIKNDKNPREVITINNITFYPNEYFCPLDYETRKLNITNKTVAVHWYGESWLSNSQKRKQFFLTKIKNLIGIKKYNKIKNLLKR